MAKKSQVMKNLKRQRYVERYSEKRAKLLSIIKANNFVTFVFSYYPEKENATKYLDVSSLDRSFIFDSSHLP